MFGSNRLFTALNVSAITTLLDTYLTKAAIFPSALLPEQFTGTESINYYLTSPYNAAMTYAEYIYIANCRSITDIGSRTIAQAVIDINETAITDGFLYCSLLPTIPPIDKDDTYNTPVEVRIKSRT